VLIVGKGTHYCAYCGYDMKAKEERLCVDCDGDTCKPKKREKRKPKLTNPTISPLAELDRWKKAHALMWLRLAWARGVLHDMEISVTAMPVNGWKSLPEKLRTVLRETQTNDAPSDELIDWAKAHVLKEQKRAKGKKRTT